MSKTEKDLTGSGTDADGGTPGGTAGNVHAPSGNAGKVSTANGNAGKVSTASGNAGKASTASGNAGKASTASGNAGKVSTASGNAGKVSTATNPQHGGNRRNTRRLMILAAAAAVGLMLTYAFWPRPTLVDIGTVTTGPMRVTIDEEGYTQVHDPFVLSTPVAGRLLRVEVEPGDRVTGGTTVVARMQPTAPSALDLRSREQARASVDAAGAALRAAEADVKKAMAERDLAQSSLSRTESLFEKGIVAQAALDSAQRAARLADATLDTARAAVSMRVADMTSAEALLMRFDDPGLADALGQLATATPLYAPASGTILRVIQQSETTLAAGTPVLEIGDIENGLEVRADLLSTDAVGVSLGDAVLIENWGREAPLSGTITRIAPRGFTKVSALGVEEQRVAVTIGFTDPPEARAGLGHGYRVEARIVAWQSDAAVLVPSGALLRKGEDWMLFTVENGRAKARTLRLVANNGLTAAVAEGLDPGTQIVLYPPAGLQSGQKVAQRSSY